MIPFVLSNLLAESASRHPDRIAITQKQRIISFGELHHESHRMKEFLFGSGIKKGDRVGILLDKSIEQLVSMFGAAMAGSVFVFINPALKKEQIEYIIQDCQIRLLVTSSVYYTRNKLAIPESVLFVDDTSESPFPVWKKIKNGFSFKETFASCIADDIASLIYTSGSTGKPKGVVVPHRTLIEGAEIVSTYLGITENDRIIGILPFNFDYGLNQALTAILKGATLVLHNFILVKDLLDILQSERITGFAGMTPIWTKLVDQRYKWQGKYDFSHLRYITSSGGKVPRIIVDRMRSMFPSTKIYLMYGLTEAFRSTYLPPEELERRPDSIGKAIPNVEIYVVDRQGRECMPGAEGELVHRGALITKGYWNDAEKTAQVFKKNPVLDGQNHLNETVVFSGDLVKKDEDGYFYFISRKDEMIKTSGYRISPTEIEEVLMALPGVSNAAVFGREIESGDQVVVAVIETPNGNIDVEEIIRLCRKRFPSYMVPHELCCEVEFPKTASGKIDRSFLKSKWIGAKVR